MYDKVVADEIVERLTRDSLRSICRDPEMPDRRTVERWMQTDPDFAAKCAHARVIQADNEFDGLSELEDRVLSGEVDASAARVVIASRQWRLAKIASKKYGDKIETIHSGELAVNHVSKEQRDAAVLAATRADS